MCTKRRHVPGKQRRTSDSNKSHELPELNSNCHQTKSSLSVWKKGVFWGTLEWILLPRRETNWARQASLREWLKLVCGSASAPPNKEEKPLRERGREWGKMRAKKKSQTWPWHINGASEAGGRKKKNEVFFSAVASQWSYTDRHGRAEQTHKGCSSGGKRWLLSQRQFLWGQSSGMKSLKASAALGWKDGIRRDGVVCATNWDIQECNWHSAAGLKKELPSASCYGCWGVQLTLTGVLTFLVCDGQMIRGMFETGGPLYPETLLPFLVGVT